MAATMSITEARASLPALLDRVTEGDEVSITRHGKVIAVIVRPDVLRVRRDERAQQEADEVHDLLDVARRRPLGRQGGLAPGRADELVAAVRRGRR